jgi:hypothetical protein
LRIVSLNIRHGGGGKRITQLARWLLSKNPAVIVLPEWRNDAAGRQLIEVLKNGGFKTYAVMREETKRNSLLVATIDFIKSENITPSTHRLVTYI